MLAPAPDVLYGHASPRIAPPLPLRHDLAGYRAQAAALGIEPMPWQDTAAVYLTALDADDLWLYREVATVVGRQQGKTTLTKPLIVERLRQGRRIMHIAQVRELPRIMFESIADALEDSDPNLFPKRRGKIIWPRRGAGSESIVLTNGGTYRIAAALGGGSRGHSIDDLLIDELREMDTFEVINSAKPAQRFSANPQTIYLSNAGTDDSVVLNALRDRAGADPSLAYLEWSADPAYSADDRRGWLQADPAIGHFPQILRDLEKDYRAAKLSGNMAGFETEALCRWVPSMRAQFVEEAAWSSCRADLPKAPRRVSMAVSLDPGGSRAAAAIAWLDGEHVCLRLTFDVTGDPVDTGLLGADLALAAGKVGAGEVGFDPMTDAELVKFLPKSKSIAGQMWANASAQFANLVKAGRLRWDGADAVTDDLLWTSRKHLDGARFEAVRSRDDRPIPAALAAIRAVWLASGPKTSRPKVL